MEGLVQASPVLGRRVEVVCLFDEEKFGKLLLHLHLVLNLGF